LHNLGFVHGDLFAPHVHVDRATFQVFLLDWQRACRSSRHCWRDLAALDVTLAASLAERRDRVACLRRYLRHREGQVSLREAFCQVQRAAKSLSGRRHVRAKAVRVDEVDRPRLLCLRGDALRVTPAFLQLWPHELPAFLEQQGDVDCEMALPGECRGRLVRRRHQLSWRHRRGAARRMWTSPERLQMNLLFRLQRFGIECPGVLAAGELPLSNGSVEAFLLTLLPADAIPLGAWLVLARSASEGCGDPRLRFGLRGNADPRRILRLAGAMLARLHEAGCRCADANALAVQTGGAEPPRIIVGDPSFIQRQRGGTLGRWWDLWRFRRSLALQDPAERAALDEGYRTGADPEENEA
jgi:hypothetical protein